MDASATICPSRGGLSLAWQNFMTVERTSLLWLTIMPILIPHSEYLLDTESTTMTLSSSPSSSRADLKGAPL